MDKVEYYRRLLEHLRSMDISWMNELQLNLHKCELQMGELTVKAALSLWPPRSAANK